MYGGSSLVSPGADGLENIVWFELVQTTRNDVPIFCAEGVHDIPLPSVGDAPAAK